MPRYTRDLNAIYISERMQENLRHIRECTMTSIVAPMGYGKTTAALWYLEERRKTGCPVFRVNIYSSDVNLFWQSFRTAFRPTALGERLEGMEFPAGQTALHLFIRDMTEYLETLEKDLFLLIDDCHLMEDSRVFDLLFALCDIPTRRLHMIVVSRSVVFLRGEELHLGNKLYKITVDDMRLNRTELSAYLRRCGMELSEEDAERLFRNSEGWFSCVYLNLCNYVKSGVLLSKGEDIYAMIGDTLYAGYDGTEQRFLLEMCIADEFTAEQAEFITGNGDTRGMIKYLAQNNAFIRYLPDTDTYRFHHMLRGHVEQLFAQLPAERQKSLKLCYGCWHESQGQYIQALRFYGEADALSRALHVIGLDRGVQLASINPEEILALLERCGEESLVDEPQALLVLMRRLFSWKQIPKMLALKQILQKAADRPGLNEEEQNNLLGECDLVMSFLGYNDIAAMSALHQKAASRMTRNAISTGNTGSYTFGSPSVLMMFHRESGRLSEEVDGMNRAMPFYYRITDNHGMGAERVMEAEALYNRGEFTDAKILLQRARDAARSKKQLYLPLCCDFLEQRLALFGESAVDGDWYRRNSETFRSANDPMIFSTLDGCMAYLAAVTGRAEQIPAWIAEGKLAEANLLNPARPMFEVIYNQVLLAKKEYIAVVARGEKLLAVCRAIPYLLCEIHLHIQLAAANDALNRSAEASDELKQALALALPDGIVMPFAENIGIPERLLDGFGAMPGVERIRQLRKTLVERLSDGEAGLASLTERERTVAKLYASGMNRKEIAAKLFLSEGTVKNYISTIYDKLHLTGTPKQKHHALSRIVSENSEKIGL